MTAENQPENQDTCSPLPLVFFNQQAAGSDFVNSWKHINRTFAYASVRSDVYRTHPKTEEADVMLQVEDNNSDDASKTQEESDGISDVPVASYLQIVGNSSPIVAISTSEFPIKNAKQDKRRIHISVSSADDDNDNDNYIEDCVQAELETMRLVHEEDLVSEDLKICSKNRANEQHISLKKNDNSEATKGSDTGKSESVVSIEENNVESAEFSIELHNVTNTKFDEQCNGKPSQEMETGNKANGRVVDNTKLPNENDHGYDAVTHSDESLASSAEARKKAMPCPGGETERVISTKTRPKGKRRRKKKSVTDGIHSDGKNGSETQKEVVPLEKVNEADKSGFSSTHCVEQMSKTGRNSATDFQQTQQHSGEEVKRGAYSENDDNRIVSYVDEFVVNYVGTNVTVTQEYHGRSASEGDGKMKPEDGKQEKYKDVYATNEDASERNGSSGIVSQLRDLLKRKSLTDSAHSVDNENVITMEADATKTFSKDNYLTVVQQNEVHEKYAGDEYYSAATDLEDPQNTAEQIYSHVDDGDDDLYCEIPAAAKPSVMNVNHDDNQYVGDGFSGKVPIYANIGLQHGTAKCDGNQPFQNEYKFAIYSNDAIDV